MKCLVLAAGYATRLYPLTENFPKPLLSVGEKTILDWLLDDIEASGEAEEYIVVSNHRFARHFEAWAKTKPYRVTVVDDGTFSNETRLGAVRDIAYVMEKLAPEDDLLVLAGDNVLDFSLSEFLRFCREKKTSCVMRYDEQNRERLKKRGVLEIDGEDRVICMEEKPAQPKTQWCCPPFYFYRKEDIRRIGEALADGCSADAPGSFVAWLCRRAPVYAMKMPGRRYDIGDTESYERVKKEYRGIGTSCKSRM